MNDYSTLSLIVWVVFAGICFASVYAFYHRRLLGDLLRSLISAQAQDEKSAKTLSEIGYGSGIKQAFAKFALKKGSVLRKTVEVVFEEKLPVRKNSDELFVRTPKSDTEQKYFVPEEKRIVAEIRYDGEGTTATTLLLSIAAFFAAAILVISFLPWILQNAGRILGLGNQEESETPPEDKNTTIDYTIE